MIKNKTFIQQNLLIAHGDFRSEESSFESFILPSQKNSKNNCDARYYDFLSRNARDIHGNRVEPKYEQKNITFAHGSPFHMLVKQIGALETAIAKFGSVPGGNANEIDKELERTLNSLMSLQNDCKKQLSPFQAKTLQEKIREVEKLKQKWKNFELKSHSSIFLPNKKSFQKSSSPNFWSGGTGQSLLDVTKATGEALGQAFNTVIGGFLNSWSKNP